MAELIGLGVALGVLGIACLIGWGIGVLLDIYWKYRVKKNRINHPKLIELQKEREKVCEEYNQWWNIKNEAKKKIDIYNEVLKYHNDEARENFLASIKEEQEKYTDAALRMTKLSPLVDAAREAEQAYREEHNIRHW